MGRRCAGVVCGVSMVGALAACSGGGGGGTTTTPTPTPTSITVSSAGTHLFLGSTETFTATVTLSNGTTQAVTGGTWSTDATGVATVGSSTGAVLGVASGEVTVIVDSQGIRGTKRIRVLPGYQGIWFGNYAVTACTQAGDFASEDLCGTPFVLGSVWSAGLNFTQTVGAITGQTLLGSLFSEQVAGTVEANGSLTFQVAATIPDTAIRVTQAWQLNIAQAGQITGTLTQTWTATGLTGQAVVATTLSNFAPSSQPSMRAETSGRIFSSPREAVAALLRGRLSK